MFSSVSNGEPSRGSSIVSQRSVCRAVALGTDKQPYPQGHALALRRRNRLPIRLAHAAAQQRLAERASVRLRVGFEFLQARGSISTVSAPSTLMSASDSCWLYRTSDAPGHAIAPVQADLEVGVVGHGDFPVS